MSDGIDILVNKDYLFVYEDEKGVWMRHKESNTEIGFNGDGVRCNRRGRGSLEELNNE